MLALLAVRHFAWENGVDIALLAPGSGKYGHVAWSSIRVLLVRNLDLSESRHRQSFPPQQKMMADTVWGVEREECLCFLGGSSTCSVCLHLGLCGG
ncbi:hypothetical protein V8E52_003248 [Russula decolorans]|jgi:hypothetical protein